MKTWIKITIGLIVTALYKNPAERMKKGKANNFRPYAHKCKFAGVKQKIIDK